MLSSKVVIAIRPLRKKQFGSIHQLVLKQVASVIRPSPNDDSVIGFDEFIILI
jgi:hypothetical protein